MPRKVEKIFSAIGQLLRYDHWYYLICWCYDWFKILCVINPAVISFWRGCVEIFLLTDKMTLFVAMIALGCFVQIIFTIARDECKSFGCLHLLAVYTFAMSAAAHWSGIWAVLDMTVGFEVDFNVAVLVMVLFLMAGMRVINNISGAPFVLEMDSPTITFDFPTMFKTPRRSNWGIMRGSTAGIDDKLTKGSSEAHFLFLSVLDSLLASLLIGPVVVAYWRGTWNLLAEYLLPDHPDWAIVAAVLFGVIGQLFFTFIQGSLGRNLHPEKHRILYYVGSRTITYSYALMCVALWQGVWKGLDKYSSTEKWIVATITGASVVALAGMRALRNISAAPFAVVLDLCEGYFVVPTMFKLRGAAETCLYVLDCFFSVVVIGSLVVFVWRGAWTLLDVLFYPDDAYVSAMGSLILGYTFILMTFSLQAPMKRLCEWLSGFWRLVAVDLYILFSFVGTINLWRGIWMLLDNYFLPSEFVLSCWLTHIFSFLFLLLINCSNSLLVRGVYIDGEEPGGKCVDFPTYYLRMFFQEQRKKKLMKQSQRMRISTLANKADEFEKQEKLPVFREDKGKGHVTVELPHVTRF